MHVLILGGTGFIGRHICREALTRGHKVTVLSRGDTVCDLPQGADLLKADRNNPESCLAVLGDRRIDCCVDTSAYRPDQLEPLLAWYSRQVPQPSYLFVSAVMVYGDCHDRPVRETARLEVPSGPEVREINGETYGPLKVACEALLPRYFPGKFSILRPQTIAGPEDPTGRFSYWAWRGLQAGPTLVPGNGKDHVQVLDVRDLARFACHVFENGLFDTYHLGGERVSWSVFVDMLGIQDPVWVDSGILASQGITFSDLPLFRPEQGLHAGLMDLDCSKALAAGYRVTSLGDTLKAVRTWLPKEFYHHFMDKKREEFLLELASQTH